MKIKTILLASLFVQASIYLTGQINQDSVRYGRKLMINGFIRTGLYGDLHDNSPKPFISSGYSDFGFKVDSRLMNSFRAFADLRFRYGSEFHEPVNRVTIREAYVNYSFGRFSLAAGQKIIKWGRADFTNPTSKLNPQNYISRSVDREDMDMGNIIAALSWSPSEKLTVEAVAVPYYRSSVLLIDPIPLPENVTMGQMNNLVTDEKLFSYGARADLHLEGIDMGVSWFEGYDPMPGITLDRFSADLSGLVPVITSGLKTKPYKTMMAGIDFEASAGSLGLRGEASRTAPALSYKTNEYVPLREVKWVAGADFTAGNWRFTAEYSGKFIPGYEHSPVDPIIGTEPDYAKLAQLMATPGFDLHEYVRQQVGAFNRLYNYQLEKWYHQAGISIEVDLLYSRFLPSLFALYNITTGDLMVIPEIRIKPVDALTLVIGSEVWSGKNGSLYHIVEDYMKSVYAGIKVDF